MQDIPFAFCDWSAFDRFNAKYRRPEMKYGKEIFIRNLFTLFLDEDDLWGSISNAIVQELLTKQGNVVVPELKIDHEELADIIKNYPTLKIFRGEVYDQTVSAFMSTIMVGVEGVNKLLAHVENFPSDVKTNKFEEI